MKTINKKLIMKLLFTTVMMTLGLALQAQYDPSTPDLIVGYQYSKSSSVHFIEGETGTLISKVDAGEPVFFTSIDKNIDIYYVQTRHFIIKGTISTGEIIDKQRVYDNEEIVETVNYDNMIMPLGVNNDGVALWSYNKELVDVQKEMLSTKNIFKQVKVSRKMNEMLQAPTPYTLYYSTTKNFEDFGSFSPRDKYPFALQGDDNIWFNNISSGELTFTNRKSGEVLISFDLKAPLKANPKYMELADKLYVPRVIDDNLFALTFYGTNPNDPNETLTLVCNNKLRRVVISSKGTRSAAVYPLYFTNSDNYVYGKTESIFNKPEPQMPPQPKIGAFGAKKKLKEYQTQLDAYTAEYQQWINESYLPENVNLLIYEDRKTEGTPMLKIEGATSAQIFNNTNVFVRKTNAFVMYDLDTRAEKWRINL